MTQPTKGIIHSLKLMHYRRKACSLITSIYARLDRSPGGTHITVQTSPGLQRDIHRADRYLDKLRELDPECAPDTNLSVMLGLETLRTTA